MKGQAGWGLGQPNVVGGISVHGRGVGVRSPFRHKPFYDSVNIIKRTYVSMILIDKKQTKNGETRFIIEFLVMFKAAEKWGMI